MFQVCTLTFSEQGGFQKNQADTEWNQTDHKTQLVEEQRVKRIVHYSDRPGQ